MISLLNQRFKADAETWSVYLWNPSEGACTNLRLWASGHCRPPRGLWLGQGCSCWMWSVYRAARSLPAQMNPSFQRRGWRPECAVLKGHTKCHKCFSRHHVFYDVSVLGTLKCQPKYLSPPDTIGFRCMHFPSRYTWFSKSFWRLWTWWICFVYSKTDQCHIWTQRQRSRQCAVPSTGYLCDYISHELKHLPGVDLMVCSVMSKLAIPSCSKCKHTSFLWKKQNKILRRWKGFQNVH